MTKNSILVLLLITCGMQRAVGAVCEVSLFNNMIGFGASLYAKIGPDGKLQKLTSVCPEGKNFESIPLSQPLKLIGVEAGKVVRTEFSSVNPSACGSPYQFDRVFAGLFKVEDGSKITPVLIDKNEVSLSNEIWNQIEKNARNVILKENADLKIVVVNKVPGEKVHQKAYKLNVSGKADIKIAIVGIKNKVQLPGPDKLQPPTDQMTYVLSVISKNKLLSLKHGMIIEKNLFPFVQGMTVGDRVLLGIQLSRTNSLLSFGADGELIDELSLSNGWAECL